MPHEDGVSLNPARLLVDILGGYTQIVRVLDGKHNPALNTKLEVTAGAYKKPISSNNIYVKTQGTGFSNTTVRVFEYDGEYCIEVCRHCFSSWKQWSISENKACNFSKQE